MGSVRLPEATNDRAALLSLEQGEAIEVTRARPQRVRIFGGAVLRRSVLALAGLGGLVLLVRACSHAVDAQRRHEAKGLRSTIVAESTDKELGKHLVASKDVAAKPCKPGSPAADCLEDIGAEARTQDAPGYKRLGHGYCSNGFYAGLLPFEAVDLATCAEKCSAEESCLYFSFVRDQTCSRYGSAAGPCELYDGDLFAASHTTYAKQATTTATAMPLTTATSTTQTTSTSTPTATTSTVTLPPTVTVTATTATETTTRTTATRMMATTTQTTTTATQTTTFTSQTTTTTTTTTATITTTTTTTPSAERSAAIATTTVAANASGTSSSGTLELEDSSERARSSTASSTSGATENATNMTEDATNTTGANATESNATNSSAARSARPDVQKVLSAPPAYLRSPHSVYCWLLCRAHTSEAELVRQSFRRKQGIFGCDASDVLADYKFDIGEGVDVVAMGDMTAKIASWGSFANSAQFLKAWDKIVELGHFWKFSWTVKVDPDSSFDASRLQGHMPNWAADKAFYVRNWDQQFQLLGPIEILSALALKEYYSRKEDCIAAFHLKDCGEDGYLGVCLRDILKFDSVLDMGVLDNTGGNLNACYGSQAVVIHPYKDPNMLGQCLDAMLHKR